RTLKDTVGTRTDGAEEQVDRQKVSILRRVTAGVPSRHLRIVAHPGWITGIMLDRVQKPAPADWVAGLRNANAFVEGPTAGEGRESEVADHPAVSLLIVHYEGITVIVVLAWRACEWSEKRVERCPVGSVERVTAFVEDLE